MSVWSINIPCLYLQCVSTYTTIYFKYNYQSLSSYYYVIIVYMKCYKSELTYTVYVSSYVCDYCIDTKVIKNK